MWYYDEYKNNYQQSLNREKENKMDIEELILDSEEVWKAYKDGFNKAVKSFRDMGKTRISRDEELKAVENSWESIAIAQARKMAEWLERKSVAPEHLGIAIKFDEWRALKRLLKFDEWQAMKKKITNS